ncbi:MAG: hypothetical protein M0R33_14025 [Methylomonas sp.]|uniref:hypothetical protein n=1 Tax=Methylomonas sp. TaxID=418 RepID=UPI0025D12081|nr:hypothetical protein [Methylomonas sp.]MCK9607554.1 hypothetical protein [Methylomonas sp.]
MIGKQLETEEDKALLDDIKRKYQFFRDTAGVESVMDEAGEALLSFDEQIANRNEEFFAKCKLGEVITNKNRKRIAENAGICGTSPEKMFAKMQSRAAVVLDAQTKSKIFDLAEELLQIYAQSELAKNK